MSTLTAALTAALIVVACLLLLAAGLGRAAGMASRTEEARGRVWDERLGRWVRLPYGAKPGPGQLTEAEVDSLDRFHIALDDLVGGPQWDAGRERLFDAVRDHRTNTTEGET